MCNGQPQQEEGCAEGARLHELMRLRDFFLIVQRPLLPAEGGEPIAAALKARESGGQAGLSADNGRRPVWLRFLLFSPPTPKETFPAADKVHRG